VGLCGQREAETSDRRERARSHPGGVVAPDREFVAKGSFAGSG
jgi:hypothetical protein